MKPHNHCSGTLVPYSSGQTLTSEMLSSPSQQAVEDVEGPFIFGLSNGPRLLQKVWEQTLRIDQVRDHVKKMTTLL